jgi:hypothetical protein
MSGMIAKLNNDGAFHRWRWSCVWRPGVGGGLDARGDWVRAGGVGAGDGWLTVELGSGEDAGFKLWETREALEFQRFAYGIGFDDLEFSEFLKKNYCLHSRPRSASLVRAFCRSLHRERDFP